MAMKKAILLGLTFASQAAVPAIAADDSGNPTPAS